MRQSGFCGASRPPRCSCLPIRQARRKVASIAFTIPPRPGDASGRDGPSHSRLFGGDAAFALRRSIAPPRVPANIGGVTMRFEGTKAYVATDDLKVAVNAAITLERPLLVKGEPGTGKTVLALEIAKALGAPLIEWHIKSTTKALQGLYEYDAVSRLRDSQLGDQRVADIRNYIKRGKLWDAFVVRRAPGAADRRDRQGRHRVSQRPAAGTRSHGVLRLRDERDHQGAPPAGRGDHVEQREGAARRVPAPLLLPLHPLSRCRHDERDHRGAFPRHQAAPGRRGAASCSTRSARCRA